MGSLLRVAFLMIAIAATSSCFLGAEARAMDSPVEPAPSCAAPDEGNAAHCRQIEAHILATTLRLRIEELGLNAHGAYEVVDTSIGHATVMAGRYLVTHNHFTLSLENRNDNRLRRLSAYAPDGSVIVQHAPLHTFERLLAEPQTLVLDFGTYGRQGALAYFGFESAHFADWRTLHMQAGDEVAQVNWDGRSTYVEWVRVVRARNEDGTPALVLDNYVRQGASGGGVFFEGVHLGNNWFHGSTQYAQSGEQLWQFTVAALNGSNLMAFLQGEVPDLTHGAGTPSVQATPAAEGVGMLAQ